MQGNEQKDKRKFTRYYQSLENISLKKYLIWLLNTWIQGDFIVVIPSVRTVYLEQVHHLHGKYF
jgi:hypothetical protein